MRTSAHQLQVLARSLDDVFVTPPQVPDEAPEEDFELAVEVDELQSTVVGGLSRTAIRTGAVLDGIEQARTLIAKYERRMSSQQLAAVRDLLEALQSA